MCLATFLPRTREEFQDKFQASAHYVARGRDSAVLTWGDLVEFSWMEDTIQGKTRGALQGPVAPEVGEVCPGVYHRGGNESTRGRPKKEATHAVIEEDSDYGSERDLVAPVQEGARGSRDDRPREGHPREPRAERPRGNVMGSQVSGRGDLGQGKDSALFGAVSALRWGSLSGHKPTPTGCATLTPPPSFSDLAFGAIA